MSSFILSLAASLNLPKIFLTIFARSLRGLLPFVLLLFPFLFIFSFTQALSVKNNAFFCSCRLRPSKHHCNLRTLTRIAADCGLLSCSHLVYKDGSCAFSCVFSRSLCFALRCWAITFCSFFRMEGLAFRFRVTPVYSRHAACMTLTSLALKKTR